MYNGDGGRHFNSSGGEVKAREGGMLWE